MLEVLPRETVYSLRRSVKADVQQMFIPDEENLTKDGCLGGNLRNDGLLDVLASL